MSLNAKVAPLGFQLEVEFLDRLSEPVREKKAQSVSAIIRTALERYDFTNMVVIRPPQVMTSVRLPVELRRSLKKTARAKHTSVGQLVRTAVEAYLPQLESEIAGQLRVPIAEAVMPAAQQPKTKAAAKKRSAAKPRTPVAAKLPVKTHKAGHHPKTVRRIMTKKRKG